MLFIGPSFAKLTSARRRTLSLIRVGVILLALVAALRPGCVQTIEKNQSAVLLFLVDVTRSMDLPHIADDSTRWKETVAMIQNNESRFKQLAENKVEVKFYAFDNQTRLLESENGIVALPPKPEGGETDIGTAIYDTSLDVRDQRLIGMCLVSDGVQNIPEPDIELSQSTEALTDREAPLIAIQMGISKDTGQLHDVAITSFAEQQVVNKNNDLVSRATMVTRGYGGQDVTIQLIVTDVAGKETIVASEVHRPATSYEETNVTLKYRPTEPGEYRIKVRAVPMPDEPALRNNSLDGFLTVRDEGMQVLFLNGSLGNEQLFLRRYALPVLDFISMDFYPIYTFANRRSSWPLKKYEAEFRDPKKYDVFVLCNVDSRALSEASWQALADAVGNGKGLLMIGGTHSFGAGQFQNTPLKDVLPIKMKRNESQPFDQDIRKELHINSPIRIRPTGSHFLTDITDSETDKATWAKFPPLPGANRIVVKDMAKVYLESDDDVKRPIMASANFGGGRVLVFAGDSTWRWHRSGFKEEYNRFWRQVILWLAFWDSRNDESVSIELPKRRFSPKSNVKFGVAVKSISGEFIDGVAFDANLILPSGESRVISINPAGQRYESELDPELLAQSGVYRIQVAANRNGVAIGQSEREFVVMDRDKEKSNPAANPEQMKRLANQTSEFGGMAIAPEQLSDILDQYIENPPTTKIEIPTKQRLGGEFWSSFVFLLMFVGLLSLEWLLRKKWGLV